MNDALPKASFAAVAAEVSPMSSAVLGGSGILSARPAYQAAGSMNSDRITKPATPTRQPKPSFNNCPTGADTNAPSDPAAETMPITVLRTVAGTARADTDIAIALAVQASEVPISTPAPIRIGIMPFAVAIKARPTMYITEPTIMMGLNPQRTDKAPATGCRNP